MNGTLAASRPATQKQFDFIKRLVAERDTTAIQTRLENDRAWATVGRYDTQDASSLIDLLLAQPKKAATQETIVRSEPEAGVYVIHGDEYVRVYLGQQSGRMLAKRINMEQDGGEWTVHYEYLGVATKVLTPQATPERLSIEEVGSLGITTNHCLICGRRLDDPESVDRGIGPVCARNY